MYNTLFKRSTGIQFSRRFAMIYGVIAAGTLLWCIAFIASPRLIEMGGIHSLFAIGFRYFYSFICHQNPDRSFHVLGHSMAVCARCTGIYFGALIGILTFPFTIGWFNEHSPWKKWLVIVIGLNLIEFTLSSLNLFSNLILRAGTGLTLGLGIASCALFAIFTHIQIRLKWRDST
ncbi:DUF2085 domain-containing protein [candidate division KSB1 bacterium]|nr:DUF2085 domain-containing protein [candidate division KSB1 bacterium]